ncbi:cytochrome P450 [Ilumatobacter sp.]|uniref:cytochrome P450 n=1 Tax=Ilumatobacter sp. TaxID=1967498 RepID=UPI003751D5F1
MASDIDLFDPATQESWFPTYRRLHAEAPVFQIPGTTTYVVSRYADVMHVLRHQDVFPSGTGLTNRHAGAVQVYQDRGWDRIAPLSVNPPEHREYRKLVDHFFDATGSALYAETIQAVIDELIDSFLDDGQADFMQAFALPLPVRMITRLLGFPDEDIDRLKAWSTAWVLPFSGGLTDEQQVWVAEQVVEFQTYIQERLDEKRLTPGDDVLSKLSVARYNDERPLTDPEIISIIDHLYIGGNETTTFALASAVWILLREPGLYERVRDDRSLVVPFLEESMRLESPTQGLYRRVARDTELAGVALPEGATVHIRYGAANRDGDMFPDPDNVDLERPNMLRHVAFSLGEHRCPGEGLSRLEQRMALNTILDRLPGLRLSADNDFTHAPGFVLRALNRLNVAWTPST